MPNLSFDIFWKDHGAEKGMKGLGNETEKSHSKLSKFSGVAASAGLVAGAALVGFGTSSVAAFKDAEESQDALANSFKKFPKLADTNLASLQNLNSELERKTKFDDDATASGQSVLATFGLTGTQIQQLTPLLQDYAAKTGKDLPSAAKDLGKAVLGQGRALKNVGLDLKDTGDHSKNLTNLMGGLNEKVGGFAENQGKGAAGQAQILSNEFGEVEESVGAKLVPALTKMGGVLLDIISFTQKYWGVIGPVVLVLGTFLGTVFLITKAVKTYTAVQAALNIVMTANPIGLVIVAIALLVAGIVIAYKKSDTFRHIVQGAMKGVVAAFGWLMAAGKATFNWIKGAWGRADDWIIKPIRSGVTTVHNLWDQATRWTKSAWHAIGNVIDGAVSGFKTGVRDIRSAWNKLEGYAKAPVNFIINTVYNRGIAGLWNRVDDIFGGGHHHLPIIRGLAAGGQLSNDDIGSGFMTSGPRAIVGEGNQAHPEFVIPTDPVHRKRALGLYEKLGGQLMAGGGILGWLSDLNPVKKLENMLKGPLDNLGSIRSSTLGKIVAGIPGKIVSSAISFGKGLITKFMGAGGLGGAGNNAMGWNAQWQLVHNKFPGARLTSSFRPNARTVSGNTSYHALGRAIDVSPIMAIFNWIRSTFGAKTKELIFSPAGNRQLKDGRPHFYTGAVRAMHWNHVHWAMDQGGMLGTGTSLVTNRSGRPERILTARQNSAFEGLVQVISRQTVAAQNGAGGSEKIDYAKLGDQIVRSIKSSGLAVLMDGKKVGAIQGAQANLYTRGG